MRAFLALLLLIAVSTAAFARDLTTKDGKTFYNFIVEKVLPSGLQIRHSTGEDLIVIANLPADILSEYYPSSSTTTAAASPTPPKSLSILVAGGETYRDVVITRVEPLGIRFQHSSGVAFIDFKYLSPTDRRKFNFNINVYQQAVTAEAEHKQAVAAAREQQALAEQQRLQEAAEAARYTSRDYSTRYSQLSSSTPTPTPYQTYESDYTTTTPTYYGGGRVYVHGYYRKDGTYVRPHSRRR